MRRQQWSKSADSSGFSALKHDCTFQALVFLCTKHFSFSQPCNFRIHRFYIHTQIVWFFQLQRSSLCFMRPVLIGVQVFPKIFLLTKAPEKSLPNSRTYHFRSDSSMIIWHRCNQCVLLKQLKPTVDQNIALRCKRKVQQNV